MWTGGRSKIWKYWIWASSEIVFVAFGRCLKVWTKCANLFYYNPWTFHIGLRKWPRHGRTEILQLWSYFVPWQDSRKKWDCKWSKRRSVWNWRSEYFKPVSHIMNSTVIHDDLQSSKRLGRFRIGIRNPLLWIVQSTWNLEANSVKFDGNRKAD